MAKTAAEVRMVLAKAGGERKGRGAGYGEDARAIVLAYARRRAAAGAGPYTIGREIGLRATTLQKWVGQAPRRRESMLAEVIVAPAHTATFTLVGPTGWRVEGLDVDALRAIVGPRP